MKELSLAKLLNALYFLYRFLGTKINVTPANFGRTQLESAAKAARNKVLETTNAMPGMISWKTLGNLNLKTFATLQKSIEGSDEVTADKSW